MNNNEPQIPSRASEGRRHVCRRVIGTQMNADLLVSTLFILLISGSHVAEAGDMTSSLICPCECAMIISTCDCPTAIQVKKEISSMKENGFSEKQIYSALQAQYGNIIAHPKENPTPLWVAGIPLAIVLVLIGYALNKKPDPDIVPDMEKYEKQFEEEYRKFVSEFDESKEQPTYETNSSKLEEM